MELTNTHYNAIEEIFEMVFNFFENDSSEIRTTEVISSTARLAGSFLFRSLNRN